MKLKKLKKQKNGFNNKRTKGRKCYKALEEININIYNIKTYRDSMGFLGISLCLPPSFLFFKFF